VSWASARLIVAASMCWCACRARPLAQGQPSPAKRAAAAVPPREVRPGDTVEAVDENGRPLTFRIESVEPDPTDRDHEISLYELSVRASGGDAWRPYCPTDAEGKSRAIPLEGSWAEGSGAATLSPDRVTFACTSGALGKCVRFGYKPWKMVAGRSLAIFHAACVRMVRADYCGDGRSHTRDGTRIDVWDRVGIQRRDERADAPELFEAAWSPAGAVWVNVPRWGDDVDRLVAECPDRLRGRTSTSGALSAEDVARRFPEAVVFNARFVRADQAWGGP
jgi:hypothetical protein